MTSTIEALAEVQAAIRYVGKEGRSTEGGNYSFRRIDDLIAALHPILAEHRVIIAPTAQEVLSFQQPVPGRKEMWSSITIRVTYSAYAASDPEGAVTFQGIGIGLDNGDKGPGKALSYAYKAAVSQLFSIPTDDPAMDAEMTPNDPPSYVPDRVVDELRDRSLALKETPVGEEFRSELERRGLLPGGRLLVVATTDQSRMWAWTLEHFEDRASAAEPPGSPQSDADPSALQPISPDPEEAT